MKGTPLYVNGLSLRMWGQCEIPYFSVDLDYHSWYHEHSFLVPINNAVAPKM